MNSITGRRTPRIFFTRGILFLLLSSLLLTVCGCEKSPTLDDLHDAYVTRGAQTDGYAVSEISEENGYSYFTVEILLNADSAVFAEDLISVRAHLFRFDTEDDAEQAAEHNRKNSIGICERRGKFVLLYGEKDPFADLYREVFEQAFA